MLLVRFLVLVLAVVALIVLVALADAVWLAVLAIALGYFMAHYTGAPGWQGPSEEAQLQEAGLVEPDTGLPKRRRWNEARAAEYADEVARRGLVAVPEGWRGPEGARRVLLVTTTPVSAEQLRAALPDEARADELAVLVVVPTLAEIEARFVRGDAVEAVEHAEQVARESVEALSAAGVSASGHIGPADPAVAVSDGLRTYAAEQVVVMRRQGASARHLEEVPLEAAAGAFGVPLTEVAAGERT